MSVDPDETSYNGATRDGMPHGTGVLTFADGTTYRGQWTSGLPEGWGILTRRDGRVIYNGQWRNGKKHGRGTVYVDGICYQGDFAEGFMHGSGTMTYPNGERFVGNFDHDTYENGTMYFFDGSRIEGEWRDGGVRGVMYTRDGRKIELYDDRAGCGGSEQSG
jgi:hypothetical protein